MTILTWTQHPQVSELQTSTYHRQQLRVWKTHNEEYTGFIDELDHPFHGKDLEEVEKKLLEFLA